MRDVVSVVGFGVVVGTGTGTGIGIGIGTVAEVESQLHRFRNRRLGCAVQMVAVYLVVLRAATAGATLQYSETRPDGRSPPNQPNL